MKPNEEELEKNLKSNTDSKSPYISRRSSKQGSSQDRHGKIFQTSKGSTIRAVTPEATSKPAFGAGGDVTGPISSPPSVNARQREGRYHGDRSLSRSNTDDENAVDARPRRAQQSSISKEDTNGDPSPGSFLSKTRKRIGSMTTSTSLNIRPDEAYSSIGFPSVVQSNLALETAEEIQSPRTPRRTFSPDSSSSITSGGIRSPNLLDTDSSKILQLMKTTCGRMHGILFYRPLHTTAWASGYCAINVAPGSLVCQAKGEIAQTKTLIPDLRGCSVRTHFDRENKSTYLSVVIASSGSGFQLRPPVPETFDSWLAALLCWQPLRPKGVYNKMTKPQPVEMAERRPVGQRRISETNNAKGTAIVKVGEILFWDGALPSGSQLLASTRGVPSASALWEHLFWRKVSCKLFENGSFQLLGGNAKIVQVIQLSQLLRSSVQRLDESVLNARNCIAIYPQYTVQPANAKQINPMFICFESRTAFEAWFVLLRALTVPELYGPEQQIPDRQPKSTRGTKQIDERPTPTEMFRIERSLKVKITEAKFIQSVAETEFANPRRPQNKSKLDREQTNVYAEVAFGQDLRARTSIKPCSSSVFWADDFALNDLSSGLPVITVALRMANPGEKEWTMIAHGPYELRGDTTYLSGVGGIEISTHDPVLGNVEVHLDDLERQSVVDKWWQVLDTNHHAVGQLLMRIELQETVVLRHQEYEELSSLLHNFPNSITTQIAQLLGPELKQLSDILLDIFQASGTAHDWINSLIDEEIDGIYKDTPPVRMRFSGRIQSNDSYESAEQRELLVRELSRSATMEANLLFRGNSLVTKAVDAHMRRLGKDYLDEVLGDKLRKIIEQNPDCEVDPIKVKSPEQLEKNWANLLFLTSRIWKAIASSVEQCPPGLRILFKHIRSCAEDRYGSFIRTVKYTSVSGFLFLRFFCPAILNPKLFGLLREHPPDRAKRTFTLIAKSLNVLTNMSKFGTKEPWMEPMSKFLVPSTPEFKEFIDEICAITSLEGSIFAEPQFTAPNKIKDRLPIASREGLPSLPFLLDSAKLLADLAHLWSTHAPPEIADADIDDSAKRFHTLCLELEGKSKECLSTAEQAGSPDGKLELQWQQLLREQQKTQRPHNVFEEQFHPTADPELTALPQTIDSQIDTDYSGTNQNSAGVGSDTTPVSSTSVSWDRRIPFSQTRPMTTSTNSSTASFEMFEDARSRPLPASRDGPSKHRILDLMSSSGRRKGKGERNHAADDE